MSITFEEISADVVAPQAGPTARADAPAGEERGLAQSERIRALLLREKRRLARLSDR